MTRTNLEYQREWRRLNPERTAEQRRRWRNSHPDEVSEYRRIWARQNLLKVNGRQIRVNKRPRPNDVCEICGMETERLEYHHWDDEYPCLGLWLCQGCHRMAERIDKNLHIKYLIEKKGMVVIGRAE